MSPETRPEPTWDFFIAHAGADSTHALALRDALSPRATVFLDQHDLRPGDDWARVLPRAVRQSRTVLVLVSPHTGDAWYEGTEIAVAISFARMNPAAHRIVPVLLDEAAPIPPGDWPYGLQQLVPLSLRNNGGWTGVADALLRPSTAHADALTDAATAFVGETSFGPTAPTSVYS